MLRSLTAQSFFLAAAALAAPTAFSQATGSLERIQVFGPSLAGNLEGDDPNREVIVYLPPSYSSASERRYPVLYYLHGYTARAENYVSTLGMPAAADQAIANGGAEMIIVFPDAYTVYGGSMFSNSPTTGDWESFVARDLVSYIDANYRTIAERASRGLSGHSMGGYGTLRIGMKNPDVFSALYAASSCCLMNQAPAGPIAPPGGGRGGAGRGGFADAPKAQAAAWAPNPGNPPDYFDLPATAGDRRAVVEARWAANSPLVMVGQHVSALQRYDGNIVIDVGDQDPLGAATVPLAAELTTLGIDHVYEQYEGDHMNRIPPRFLEKVLPYFSEKLQ